MVLMPPTDVPKSSGLPSDESPEVPKMAPQLKVSSLVVGGEVHAKKNRQTPGALKLSPLEAGSWW